MHYVYDVPVLPANTAANFVQHSVKLAAGIIKHVSIIFPPGCARLVHVTIWNDSIQLLPTNPEAKYGEDAYVVEADCYIPTREFGNQLYVIAWTLGTQYKHVVTVMIDVQGIDEPDMGSSVTTLYNVVDLLVTALKRFY